ncbi:MAG: hypothetical protein FJW39_09270 [Acidobacteria bacterium]|nr:hypothetical protein [Acidobacteriota bacterium]
MTLAGLMALAVLADPRAVWTSGGATHQGSPSPDGKWLSCIDPDSGDLAVREVATGKMRRLTRKGTRKEFAYFSVMSPDSKSVAFAWFNEQGYYDLRAVDLDGGAPRLLFQSEEAGFVQPSAWSPDGKWVLTLFFRKDNISQIALVPVAGGETRVLKSLNWVYPKKMDFSPDGKWIVYDNFARDGVSQRDLFVLSADASREIRLVENPAEDLFPVWSPSGERIYFASDRAGSMDLWSVAVANGRPQGEPSLVRGRLGRILPMGITRDGSLYYALRAGGGEVYVAEWRGGFGSKPDRVGEGSSPALSPDGARLAWLAPRGAENFGQDARGIQIRDTAKGTARVLTPQLAHMERITWTRDGKSLLVGGSDGKGRGGVFRVDGESGAARSVVSDTDAPFRGFESVDTAAGVVFARGADLVLAPDTVVYQGKGPLEMLASDGRRVAFIERGEVRLWDESGSRTIGSGKEWLSLTAAGGEWLAGHSGGFTLLPSGKDAGSTKAAVTGLSVAGGYIAMSAGKPRSEIWAIDGLPR